jgi:hypothetical protein
MTKSRFLIASLALMSLLSSVGCLEYEKETTEAPSPVVVQPVPATGEVAPAAPLATRQDTTITTTSTDPGTGVVQREQSTSTTFYAKLLVTAGFTRSPALCAARRVLRG